MDNHVTGKVLESGSSMRHGGCAWRARRYAKLLERFPSGLLTSASAQEAAPRVPPWLQGRYERLVGRRLSSRRQDRPSCADRAILRRDVDVAEAGAEQNFACRLRLRPSSSVRDTSVWKEADSDLRAVRVEDVLCMVAGGEEAGWRNVGGDGLLGSPERAEVERLGKGAMSIQFDVQHWVRLRASLLTLS